ncbi:chitinase 18-18 [Metarhizium rileyi]|uniref:Chitinase 18-18 n=1 Tax=Metarhizium rileyi (strain RCEF 4871) TaxID=1649241 RepID=A0A167GTB9_METRR|nr:chitinase 18-18 [Metarhizium rileyi RCEF 4871]TWU75134.1 hypothetical protein ED733_002849 [Metarhizium rileyi]
MKFLTIASLATVAAASVMTNLGDKNVATTLIGRIGNDMERLNKEVKRYETDSEALKAAGVNIVQTLQEGKTNITRESGISLWEAFNLRQPITRVEAQSRELVSNYMNKRHLFQYGNACGVVRKQTKDLIFHCKELIDVIIDKIPLIGKFKAREFSDRLLKSLRECERHFSEPNCTDSTELVGPASAEGLFRVDRLY